MRNRNIMTAKTKRFLEGELEKATISLKEAGRKMGEAAGPDCDWHDNSAYDNAVVEYKIKGEQEDRLRKSLVDIEIIKPREEVEDVGIGNRIVVKYVGEEKNEEYTILGIHDSAVQSDWISYQTPLAKALMGKRRGDIAEIEMSDIKINVEIIDIQKGEF